MPVQPPIVPSSNVEVTAPPPYPVGNTGGLPPIGFVAPPQTPSFGSGASPYSASGYAPPPVSPPMGQYPPPQGGGYNPMGGGPYPPAGYPPPSSGGGGYPPQYGGTQGYPPPGGYPTQPGASPQVGF